MSQDTKKSATDVWNSAWSCEVHTTDYALKRIESAKSKKLTPVKIDTVDFFGYFQGSHGKYETFLDYCPCGDFKRGKLPCKHIYRLAIELGVLNVEVEHNESAILTPRKEMVKLNDTIDIIERISIQAQRKLLQIVRSNESPTVLKKDEEGIGELLESSLIVETESGNYKYLWGRKSEVAGLLTESGISYPPKAKKDELTELCIKYIPEKAAEKFGVYYISVDVPTHFSRRKIHYYLHRKFDYEIFFDPESGNTNYVPLLETVLPDDDVTDQLRKRGYYCME